MKPSDQIIRFVADLEKEAREIQLRANAGKHRLVKIRRKLLDIERVYGDLEALVKPKPKRRRAVLKVRFPKGKKAKAAAKKKADPNARGRYVCEDCGHETNMGWNGDVIICPKCCGRAPADRKWDGEGKRIA